MKQQDLAVMLNELLDTTRDSQYGFEACVAQVKSPQLSAWLLARAHECQAASSELQVLIAQCGGTHGPGGTVAGAMRRRWVVIRSNLTGATDLGMLKECELGEALAREHYQKTLELELPGPVRTVLQAHHQSMLDSLEQLAGLHHHLAHTAPTLGVPNCTGLQA